MQNVDEVLVTGPGVVQEQFIHYLKETPQYKNAEAEEKTSTKMNEEDLLQMVTDFYHYRMK